MTDDTLTPDVATAYERLTTALEPPSDHRDRVAARVTELRRRRRVVQGLASASVAAAAVGAFVVATSLGGPAPAADDGVPVASSSAPTDPSATTDPQDRASCERVAPPADADSGPYPPLRRLLEQLEAPEPVEVRFQDDGDVTTAYLIGADGTTHLQLRAQRAGGSWRVVELVRCF